MKGTPEDTWGESLIKQFKGNLKGLAKWGLCNRKSLTIEYVTAICLIDIKTLLLKIEKELKEKKQS